MHMDFLSGLSDKYLLDKYTDPEKTKNLDPDICKKRTSIPVSERIVKQMNSPTKLISRITLIRHIVEQLEARRTIGTLSKNM